MNKQPSRPHSSSGQAPFPIGKVLIGLSIVVTVVVLVGYQQGWWKQLEALGTTQSSEPTATHGEDFSAVADMIEEELNKQMPLSDADRQALEERQIWLIKEISQKQERIQVYRSKQQDERKKLAAYERQWRRADNNDQASLENLAAICTVTIKEAEKQIEILQKQVADYEQSLRDGKTRLQQGN